MASGILPFLDPVDRDHWKSAIKDRTLRAFRQWAELVRLQQTFNESGFRILPLKGPVLAQTLYHDVGQRHSSDLDILMLDERITSIIDIAGQAGYELKYPSPGLTDSQWNHYFRYKKDVGLYHPDQKVFLELHKGIDNRGLIARDMEQLFWTDLTERKMGGVNFHCMADHRTFLYLVYHGALHGYFRLFWLRDVATALKTWDLDHEQITEEALLMGIERFLGLSLELCRELLGSEIPAAYHPLLRKHMKVTGKLKAHCLRMILGPEQPSGRDRWRRQRYLARLKPGLGQTVSAIRGLLHRRYIGRYLGGH
jgi:hypothetical protein